MTTLTTRTTRLTFTAEREAATGPLTWSQQHMLDLIEALSPATGPLNPRFVSRLRPGLTEADVLDAVLDLVTTFDALRTVYVPPPEGPAQRVLRSGELAVGIVEAGAPPRNDIVAETVRSLASVPFDIESELPVRVALMNSEARPWGLVFAFTHLAMDFAAARWVTYRLRSLLLAPPAERTTPVPVHQPLDKAARQRSPAGQRSGERAVRQHESTLRAIPQTMLPRQGIAPGPRRYRYLEYRSPALGMAVPALAARHQVNSTAVLYAGICAVTGYVSGLDRSFLQLTAGNRIGAWDRFMVGLLTQDVPAYVDLADASMADVIARAEAAVTTAVRFGQYPHEKMTSRRRGIETERGLALDLSCWLNDRRDTRPLASPVDRPGPRVLEAAIARARWRWPGADERSTSTYFIYADDADDALRLTMLFDTTVLPSTEALAWMRAVERLLCTATSADVDVAEIGDYVDLTPARRGAEWCLADASWVHLPAARELVRRVARTRHAEVFAVPAGASPARRLIAFLDGGRGSDVERLHADCVAALPGLRTAVAPHRYIVCAGTPTRPGLEGWRRLPVLAEGSGRPPIRDSGGAPRAAASQP